MTARLSTREAERLGLTAPRPARLPYHTRCVACGEEFRTMAAETRHLEDRGHRRVVLVFAGDDRKAD